MQTQICCVMGLLCGALPSTSPLAAQTGRDTVRRGTWFQAGLLAVASNRMGDAYGGQIGGGLTLAVGGTVNRHVLLGAELDASIEAAAGSGDYNGLPVGARLLAVGRWYPSAAGSVFLLAGAGLGVDGEVADYSFAGLGPAVRAGVGLDFGRAVSFTPAVAVSALFPTSWPDSCASNQCYDRRVAVELSLAVTAH